ncbi:MAG TPA: ABC transporter substrate-binding protein [Phycisphaeraceae bacterium]
MTRTGWRLGVAVLVLMAITAAGCRDEATQAQDGRSLTRLQLVLNWVPEPEFGGFYAAKLNGAFASRGLEVEILPGGAGSPSLQMVAAGQAELGIVSADEIILGRARGMKIVGLFAVFQTNPQGIMAHQEQGFQSLEDLLQAGRQGKTIQLAVEPGLPYTRFLEQKYGFDQVQRVPYTGGIALFLNNPNLAQQCFVTAEPIAAERQGAKPQVFLIAESGYNPYTAVVAAREDFVQQHPDVVKAFVEAAREGWRAYLDDPGPANELIAQLNPAMDAQTLAQSVKVQQPLIENEFTQTAGIGAMTAQRWEELGQQLVQIGLIDHAPPAEECFIDVNQLDGGS